VNLTDSKATLALKDLKEGNYSVVVEYVGDNNFTGSVNEASFVVTPGINIDVGGSGNNTVINITVPGNATGNVTVLIDNETYIITNLTNGSAIVNLTNVTPGEHNITVIYTDGNGTNTTANKVIMVSLYDTPITISVENTNVGDVTKFTVTVPQNATGDVTIRIDGLTVTNSTNGGVAVFYVAGLTAGNKTVTAFYAADEMYAFNATAKDFNITKLGPEAYGNASLVNVSAEDIYVGQTARIDITAPSDYNGTAVVNVGGVNYTATINNGVGFVEIAKLANGTYNITVTLAENDKYYSYVNDTVGFKVSKRDSEVTVGFNNITVGEYVAFEITVSDFGNVTIAIGNLEPVVVGVKAGANTIYVPDVPVGEYDVIVTYSGNYKYLSNSSEAMKLNVNKTQTAPEDIRINDTGNGTIIITVPENATGNVTVIINGENKTVNITNGTAVIDINNITNATPGVNNITIIYSGDENNTGIEFNTTVNIPKWDSAIDVTAIDIKEGAIEFINVNVTKGATGLVLLNVSGTGYYVNLTDSKATLQIKGLTEGSYTVKATYLGDANYTGSVDETSFVVTQGITIDVGGSGNGTVINITVPGNATGNVTVLIDNETYIVTNLTNGSAIINLTNVTPGQHNVTVIYTDENGTNTTANKVITISKYDLPIDIQVENLYVGDTTKVTVTVPVNATQDITIGVGGKTYTNSTSDGVATFYVTGLTAGDKTIVAIYPGDETYAFNATAANFTVLKHSSQITVSAGNITAGEYTLINVTVLPGDATGYVIVNVNGTKYSINLTNGENSTSVLVVKAGTFTVDATYIGDHKYESSQNSTTFDAAKVLDKVEISIEDKSVNEVVATVVVPSDAGGNATVIIDNETVKVVELEGGINNIVVSNVTEGVHNVTVVYSGDGKYDSKTVSENVTVIGSIIAPKDLIRAWNSPYDYEAEFLDKDGYVLANTDVKIVVDGKEYTVKTDEKGVARLTDARLAVGTHNVTLINPVTGQKVDENVTIVERIIGNKDLSLDYYDGTKYVVRAIGDDGKPVGAGEVVGFHVNGVDYNGITDKDGYARLLIELNPKSYTITAQYRAYKVSNKITVKQTLKLLKTNIKVKKSAKKLVIKAELKWTNGKAISGKKLTLKFKGKSYTAKTNSKGIAKFKVKKKVIKKLKKGKSYKYSVKYITNQVKGTVKVKK
jgi:predicted  nucleic acid-binding Zn-ribbon protein